MPFAKPLRTVPAPLTPLSHDVDDRGVPTKDSWTTRLRDSQVAVQAALTELEPP